MKVKELIAYLETLDPELTVTIQRQRLHTTTLELSADGIELAESERWVKVESVDGRGMLFSHGELPHIRIA